MHNGGTRALNTALLARQIPEWDDPGEGSLLWTFSPITYGLHTRVTSSVYHCVDLLGEVPGIDSKAIDFGERELAAAGVPAIATSEVVSEHLRSQGFSRVLLWPNVADVEVFHQTAEARRRPAAVFAGNLTELKIDFALLEDLIGRGVELHLAGPISEGGGDGRRGVERLIAAGANYHGQLGLPALASLLNECEVGLIPYVLNEYTRGVSPLKTYEYLASGLHVVSTPVPSVRASANVTAVESRAAFVEAVLGATANVAAAAERDSRIAEAYNHSWALRGEQIRSEAKSLLGQ